MSSEAVSAHTKLSSSLKERLKRCGRYHSSPTGAPPKKRICYPAGTLPRTPEVTGPDGKGDNQPDTLSTPAKSAAGCVDQAVGTGATPLKSNNSTKLKIDSITPANRKNINTFTSPAGFSNKVDDSTATYRKNVNLNSFTTPKTSTVESSLSLATQDTTNESQSTISIMASPTFSDANNSYSKRQSGEISRHAKLCSLTPDTTVLIPKNITDNVGRNNISEQRYERTPIRSRNVSSCCKPSRLHFPGVSSYIDNNSTGGSPAACKRTEQAGFQITPVKLDTQSGAKSLSTDDAEMLQEKYERLKNTLSEKEEELRKLNLVKMYRTKNDLESLGVLVKKWQMTSQQALVDLHNKLQDPKPSLTQLIDHLQIEHSLILFNPEEETFN